MPEQPPPTSPKPRGWRVCAYVTTLAGSLLVTAGAVQVVFPFVRRARAQRCESMVRALPISASPRGSWITDPWEAELKAELDDHRRRLRGELERRRVGLTLDQARERAERLVKEPVWGARLVLENAARFRVLCLMAELEPNSIKRRIRTALKAHCVEMNADRSVPWRDMLPFVVFGLVFLGAGTVWQRVLAFDERGAAPRGESS